MERVSQKSHFQKFSLTQKQREHSVGNFMLCIVYTNFIWESNLLEKQKSPLPWVAVVAVVKSRKMVEKEKLNEAVTKPGARLLSNPRRDSRQAGTGLDKSQNGQKQTTKKFLFCTCCCPIPRRIFTDQCCFPLIVEYFSNIFETLITAIWTSGFHDEVETQCWAVSEIFQILNISNIFFKY